MTAPALAAPLPTRSPVVASYALNDHNVEKRRVRGDLIQVFRIVKGFDKIKMEDFFLSLIHI